MVLTLSNKIPPELFCNNFRISGNEIDCLVGKLYLFGDTKFMFLVNMNLIRWVVLIFFCCLNANRLKLFISN